MRIQQRIKRKGEKDMADLTVALIDWLKSYKDATKCEGVVVGISGGKDSATVAMLAKKVWGENVVGVMMPDGAQSDLADSVAVCSTLQIKNTLINIGQVKDDIIRVINRDCPLCDVSDKAATNIPPRIRMTVLYAIAQSLGYRVIGTGNASEAFIGWTTKWGDSACDFNPIADLTCSEVVAVGLDLARDFGLPRKYITKDPSDGLTGTPDEANFGFTYWELDAYIRGDGNVQISDDVKFKIVKMHEATAHKRMLPPHYTR